MPCHTWSRQRVGRPNCSCPWRCCTRCDRIRAAARNAAKRAATHFSKAAQSNPAAWEYRVRWGQSEALQKNFPEAVRILQAGLTSASPQPFHEALVGVYLAWYAVTPAQTPEGLATRLELLNQALAHGPNHPQVLTLLAELSMGDGKGADIPGRASRRLDAGNGAGHRAFRPRHPGPAARGLG